MNQARKFRNVSQVARILVPAALVGLSACLAPSDESDEQASPSEATELSVPGLRAGEQTIFANATPKVASDPDGASVELGLKFRAKATGKVTGVRFFKGAGNSGTHVGHLWGAGSAALATVTFTAESASGWQLARFASPVTVTANTTYVVSYYAPRGHYAGDNQGMATARESGVLTGLANGQDGPNGVYRYGAGGKPTASYGASNYFVDVVFLPDAAAPIADAGAGDAAVPSDAGPVPADAGTSPAPAPAWSRGFSWYTANTGVPAGTALTASPALTITTPGTIIDGLDVAGGISVNAKNVTIRNSRVRGTISNNVGTKDANLVVDHCEVDLSSIPIDASGNSNKYGVAAWWGVTVKFSKIHGMAQGVAFAGYVVVNDSWIYGIRSNGQHSECILSNGDDTVDGGNSSFRRNWLDADETYAQGYVSSALSMYGDYGQIKNIALDGNFFTGGGYLLYPGATSQKPYPMPSNVIVTNSVFDPKGYGPVYPSELDPVSTAGWANNKLVNGTIVPAPTGNQ